MRWMGTVASIGSLCGFVSGFFDKPVDDRAILEKILTEAPRRLSSKSLTDAPKLRGQLHRQFATFMLPQARSLQYPEQSLYAKAKSGVLVLGGIYKCSNCSDWHVSCAGGFILTADGKAVTNYHVIAQAAMKAFVALDAEGQVYDVSAVLAADKSNDVAIIQLKLPTGKRLSPMPVAQRAEPGETVYVISHPDANFYMLTKGVVARYAQKGQTTWMCITAEYAKGSSGGPVLNEKGQVVGMVANTKSIYYTDDNGKQENLQMVIRNCVPSASILKLIR